jgi:hypothetical protein
MSSDSVQDLYGVPRHLSISGGNAGFVIKVSSGAFTDYGSPAISLISPEFHDWLYIWVNFFVVTKFAVQSKQV